MSIYHFIIRKYALIAWLILVPVLAQCQLKNPSHMTTHQKDNDPGRYRIQKNEADWRVQLAPMQYYVLRQAGTERPYTGEYYQTDEAGIYYSAATGQPLFYSDTKFDSGCGWPSFFEPITPGAVYYRTDRTHGMIRTEVIDSGSGSHLGHVFNDGPQPTGLRYCMNSAALIFVALGGELPPIVQEYFRKYATEEERQLCAGPSHPCLWRGFPGSPPGNY